MHLSSIQLEKLRNAEYLQFLTDALAIVDASQPASSPVAAQRTALTEKRNAIDTLFAQDRASSFTEVVTAADERRDGAWTGLRLLLTSYAYHYEPAARERAARILRAMEIYGNAAGQAYAAETATIASFLKDLNDRPELATDVTHLDLGGWIHELAVANTTFSTLYLQRTADMAANFTSDSIKALRLESNSAWYALRDKIDGHCAVNDGALPWGGLVQSLNALIAQYTQLLAVRQGGAVPAA